MEQNPQKPQNLSLKISSYCGMSLVVAYFVSLVLLSLAAFRAVWIISLSTLQVSAAAVLELLSFSSALCCTTTTWTSGLLLPRDDAPAPITANVNNRVVYKFIVAIISWNRISESFIYAYITRKSLPKIHYLMTQPSIA